MSFIEIHCPNYRGSLLEIPLYSHFLFAQMIVVNTHNKVQMIIILHLLAHTVNY